MACAAASEDGRRRGEDATGGKPGTGRDPPESSMWVSEACRGGGIITGERELPEGEISDTTGEDDDSRGTDWVRSGPGAKNPTWRTFGSLTALPPRRGSIAEGIAKVRVRVKVWRVFEKDKIG